MRVCLHGAHARRQTDAFLCKNGQLLPGHLTAVKGAIQHVKERERESGSGSEKGIRVEGRPKNSTVMKDSNAPRQYKNL